MGKKTIREQVILRNYTEIHPALDYFGGKAIISVGRPGLTIFDDDTKQFGQLTTCIVSDGDSFTLCTKELIARQLYYIKELDLPSDRWEVRDQEDFLKVLQNGHKPDIDLQELHKSIVKVYQYLFDFADTRLHDFFACFVIYTYFFPLFDSAPVVHLWGPAGSGKTKIMETLGHLAFNPVTSGNITEAGIFRLVEGRRAVCLLDESEDLSKTDRGHAITNLVLNGYRKGNLVYRIDKVGKGFTSSHYNVFSPKVIANIKGLDKEALISRAIRITTSNTNNKIKSNRSTSELKKDMLKIRDILYQAALTKFPQIVESKDRLPDFGLTGRAKEIWQGVLTIANLMPEEVWHNVSSLALESTRALQAELASEDPGLDIIEALSRVIQSNESKFYTNDMLADCVSKHTQQPVSRRQMGRMLAQRGFKPELRRQGDRVCRGFTLSKPSIDDQLVAGYSL